VSRLTHLHCAHNDLHNSAEKGEQEGEFDGSSHGELDADQSHQAGGSDDDLVDGAKDQIDQGSNKRWTQSVTSWQTCQEGTGHTFGYDRESQGNTGYKVVDSPFGGVKWQPLEDRNRSLEN